MTFTDLVDLASRALGASVVAANDDWFAEKENLLRPEPPEFRPHTFGPRGQIMDGWETRRRRGTSAARPHPGADEHDLAVVRLGAPGVIRGLVVDTSYFTGNFPPFAAVDAAFVPGYPAPDELGDDVVAWREILPRTALKGDTVHQFEVTDPGRYSHVRLRIYPDGGIARLRVHGEVVPDPDLLDGLTVDLAAQVNGGVAEAASDRFYSSPHHVNAPGRSRVMGEGWENRRRRDDGNDWVRVRLAGRGHVDVVEIDTGNYLGNAPGWAMLSGIDATAARTDARTGTGPGMGTETGTATGTAGGAMAADLADPAAWTPLLPPTRLQPDTRHRFRLPPDLPAVTHVRLDVLPDGGIARLRVHGRLTEDALRDLRDRVDRDRQA